MISVDDKKKQNKIVSNNISTWKNTTILMKHVDLSN